jgi:hypothetical protein
MRIHSALLLLLLTAAPAAAGAAEAEAQEGLAAPSVPSILGAESLQGGSSVLAWAGYGSVGGAYGQGITTWDDLILQADFDWAYTELTPSLAWKRPIAWAAPWTMAMRLGVGWYVNLGGTWIHGFNEGDRGLAINPAVIASTHAGEGLVALTVEAPVTVTRWRSGGYMVAPKAALSFETPLYGDLTMGIGAGLRWRAGAGGAPSTSGRTDLQLLVLIGHRVL